MESLLVISSLYVEFGVTQFYSQLDASSDNVLAIYLSKEPVPALNTVPIQAGTVWLGQIYADFLDSSGSILSSCATHVSLTCIKGL